MHDVREALMVGRTSDGRTVRRPLSPHLQIYKPQLTSALSIFHRMSGVVLAIGALLLAWWLVAAATSDAAFGLVVAFLRSWIGLLLLAGWAASLWFHFCNGISHLAWDIGRGFTLPQVHASGRLVLAATAVLTVATCVAALALL